MLPKERLPPTTPQKRHREKYKNIKKTYISIFILLYYLMQLKYSRPQPAALGVLTAHDQADSRETAGLEHSEKCFCCQYK